MANLYTYAPYLVEVSIFGIKLKGLSPSTMAEIVRDKPSATYRKAQDGTMTVFRDRYATHKVSVHIDQTSESNTILHLIYKLYQTTGVEFKIPIIVSEKTEMGGTQFTAFDCFFESEPDTTFADTSGDKVWTFICHNGSYSQAGTYEESDLFESIQTIITVIETASAFGLNLGVLQDKLTTSFNNTMSKAKALFGGSG